MNILAIDTTGSVSAAAVMQDDKLLAETYRNDKLTHSQTLLCDVDDVLHKLDLTLQDMDVFAVTTGPGSFTGIRIGIATVKGFAQGLGRPIVAMTSLAAMCYNFACSGKIIAPCLDARNHQVFGGAFRFEKDALITLLPECAYTVEDFAGELKQLGAPVLMMGDGAVAYRVDFGNILGQDVLFAPGHLAHQRASSLGYGAYLKSKKQAYTDVSDLDAFYARLSQAEQERERRMKQ